jgi:hypothetical protein
VKHTKDIGKYAQPKAYSEAGVGSGYPNKVANTQTVKIRGTGVATKGTGSSKKLG